MLTSLNTPKACTITETIMMAAAIGAAEVLGEIGDYVAELLAAMDS